MTAPTRSNVLRTRRRLEQVDKGASLLRNKRSSLALELFARARPVVDSRRIIEEQALAAYRALLEALAALGRADLAPFGWPTRELRVELTSREVAGIRGVDLGERPTLVRSVAARGVAVGPGDGAAADAAAQFERLLEELLAAAPEEVFIRRLAAALRRTTRLVNTLEQRVAPALERDLAAMRRTLDEREREDHTRLKRMSAKRAKDGG